MKSGEREDPVHYDGGASFLHAGITLRGKRTLFCRHGAPVSNKQKDSPGRTDARAKSSAAKAVRWSELPVIASPGHVYIGCLCGPEHYVQHQQVAEQELFPSRWDRSRSQSCCGAGFSDTLAEARRHRPVPKKLWDALAPVVATVIEEETWKLPDLVACEAELAKLKG